MFDDISTEVLAYLLSLFLSLLCGTIIGAERELKKKPAGISTQTMVIGAAMTFAFISAHASGSNDSTRIAAQIVSGVGFLGAGIILKSTNTKRVSNVTTAASIWYGAAIGMALGFSMYPIAIAATIYAIISGRMPKVHKRNMDDPSSSR